MQHLLFNRGRLSEFLETRRKNLRSEVESFSQDYLLTTSEAELIEYLVRKFLVDTPELLNDKISAETPHETKIDVSRDPLRAYRVYEPAYVDGMRATIIVPFKGDSELFQYQPSSFSFSPPQGEIDSNRHEIRLEYVRRVLDSAELKKTYTETVGQIKKYLDWVRKDVQEFNNSLEKTVTDLVTHRKKRINESLDAIHDLGIPMKRREDAPQTYAVPNVRRKPKIQRPEPKVSSYEPEPTLPESEYEHILSIIKNMVLVMERSPQAFGTMNEEDLRQHFLVQLNGQYEGNATGETFNVSGKTDILIRHEGKNVFIAECKFWKGKQSLLDAIDQLLSYTSWRDSKTALIVFYRGDNPTLVLKQIRDVVQEHPNYIRDAEHDDTAFRFVMHQPNDELRQLHLAVMVFHVPQAS